MSAAARLLTVKLAHTLIWVFFASCVMGIPLLALGGRNQGTAMLSAVVLVEVVILALNQWRCPLTAVAAQYTNDRRDNFDIFLPEWLARHTKTIFGALYVAGLLLLVIRWATDD